MIAAEQELIRRLQSRSAAEARAAFAEFVELHRRRLYALAYHLTGNAMDAEDLAQEAFVKAFLNIEKFRGQSQLFTWLHRLTVNVFLDGKRSNARRPRGEIADTAKELEDARARRPDEIADAAIAAERLTEALGKLSPQQRAVFVLRHYHDKQLSDIAETLNVTEGTVKTLLFRAIQRLRGLLAAYYQELVVTPSNNGTLNDEQ